MPVSAFKEIQYVRKAWIFCKNPADSSLVSHIYPCSC